MSLALLTSLLVLSSTGIDDEYREPVDEDAFEVHGLDRSARLHVLATAGAIGVGAGNPKDYGTLIVVGVPLYLGTRRPHSQWLIDTHFSFSYGLETDRVFLVVSPTAGMNWYFFGWFGFELRGGVGLAVRWTSQVVGGGIGYVLETAFVLRPFEDDHVRIKLGSVAHEILAFSPDYTGGLSLTVGLGFETKI